MIQAIGLDLVEVNRLRTSLERFGERFRNRVFTPRECSYCERHADPVIHFAARFAAKEATMKALGTGWGQGVEWKQIEVVSEGDAPSLSLTGRAREICGACRIHVSLTHTETIAAAVVILERA